MRKEILFFTLIIFLSTQVLAQTQINIYLSENGDARFYGKTDENISLPKGVFIQDRNILGTSKILTRKEGEIWLFNYSLKNSNLNIILPKNAVIKDLRKGEIYLEEGRLSVYNDESIEIYYTLEEPSYAENYIYAGIIGLLLILFYIIYKIFSKKIESKDDLEIIKKTLSERENLIIDKLEEVKEIKQSRLSKLTEIPKASLFRHLIQLEKKGIIKRVGEGKNKIISLK